MTSKQTYKVERIGPDGSVQTTVAAQSMRGAQRAAVNQLGWRNPRTHRYYITIVDCDHSYERSLRNR
jgi:hypothetical protein